MSNGAVEIEAAACPVDFDLSHLSYGDFVRLQHVDATTPAGLDVLNAILDRAVVGGLDAIPILETRNIVGYLMTAIREGMSPKAPPAEPSLMGSDAAGLDTIAT